jgi:hypothetical protein
MSCERYADAIIDHACGAEIASDARRHLEACDACHGRFDEQRRMMSALDAELQTALAIEPSPYFDSKVRTRIAQTAPASARTFWWPILTAAAVAMIALGVAAIRSMEDKSVAAPVDVARVTPSTQPTPTITRTPAPPPSPPRDTVDKTPEQTANPPASRPRRRSGSSLPEVEVVVSAEQSKAIERYMTLLRRGTLDTSSLVKEIPIAGEMPALAVGPLTVEPLAVPDVESGSGPAVDRTPGM